MRLHINEPNSSLAGYVRGQDSRDLRKHGISEETISSVVERLERSGLIDDKTFARLGGEPGNSARECAPAYELRQQRLPLGDRSNAC
jgi:hypothetical protein